MDIKNVNSIDDVIDMLKAYLPSNIKQEQEKQILKDYSYVLCEVASETQQEINYTKLMKFLRDNMSSYRIMPKDLKEYGYKCLIPKQNEIKTGKDIYVYRPIERTGLLDFRQYTIYQSNDKKIKTLEELKQNGYKLLDIDTENIKEEIKQVINGNNKITLAELEKLINGN